MNSLLLGRNGRLLMPILALFLMNVPVAEAKFEWPEGTMGNFAMVGLVFISIIVGSGMLGTLVYLFRTIFGFPHESHTETDRRLREPKEWLEYMRWIAGQNPATHAVDEGAAVRVLDLEKQLFEEPPTRALPVRFFKCLIRTAKSCYTSVIGRCNSTNENSRRDKGKAPEERHNSPHPLIPIATGEGLKIGFYHAIYPATAAYRSRKVTAARRSRKSAHSHRSAKIVRDPGEIGIHYASYKPRGASIKSTDKAESTTTKNGGKISAYDPKRRSRKPIHRRRAAINSFHRFLRAAKNGFTPPTIITCDDLTIENTHRNKGKAPERRVPAPSQIPTAHRHRHKFATTIKDGVMNATHGSAKSAHRSRKSAHGHRHRSAAHHSSKSARRSGESTHRHRLMAPHSARRRSTRSTHRHKLAKIFRGLSQTAKNGIITLASGDGSTNSRLYKGKAPEPRIPLQSEVPTAHRHRHRHRSKHATTKDGTKAQTHRHHHTCSKVRSKHATSKAGGKSRTHRHHYRFLNHNADKTYESWNQHGVISPPPQAHTAATSSKHAENHVEPAAASSSHHAHLGPYKPLIRFAVDPIRPPCPPHRAHKPFQSGAPISGFGLSGLLSRKPVFPSGGSISVFDSLQPTSRKPDPPPGAPVLVHYCFEPEYHTPVPSSAYSSIPDLSYAIPRKPVPPPGASVSVLDLSQPASRKSVPPPASSRIADLSDTGSRNLFSPPASSTILNSSGTICRKPVFPSVSSSIYDLSENESRKPGYPPASSSILNSSGTICRIPVSSSASCLIADLLRLNPANPFYP